MCLYVFLDIVIEMVKALTKKQDQTRSDQLYCGRTVKTQSAALFVMFLLIRFTWIRSFPWLHRVLEWVTAYCLAVQLATSPFCFTLTIPVAQVHSPFSWHLFPEKNSRIDTTGTSWWRQFWSFRYFEYHIVIGVTMLW